MTALTLDSIISSLEDTKDTELEKAASEPSVADKLKETLTKEASDASPIGENNMSVETGNALANSILTMLDKGLEKEAAHGDMGGNLVKTDIDEMVAQQDERTQPTPRQGKSITETAKALQMRGGGEMSDTVDANDSAKEGNAPSNVPAKASDIEKMAGVNELLEEGYDFGEAVDMIKAASEAIDAEAGELEKAAAVNELIGQGVEFSEAVELVKQACEQLDGYSDLEKAAAVNELVEEDGLSFEEASDLIKEAAKMDKMDEKDMPMKKKAMPKKDMPEKDMPMKKKAMPGMMMANRARGMMR